MMFEIMVDGVAIDASSFSFNNYQSVLLAHGTDPYEIVDPVVIISGLPHTCAVCEASAADPDWSRYSNVPVCDDCFRQAEYEEDWRAAEEQSLRDMLWDNGEETGPDWAWSYREFDDTEEYSVEETPSPDDEPASKTDDIPF